MKKIAIILTLATTVFMMNSCESSDAVDPMVEEEIGQNPETTTDKPSDSSVLVLGAFKGASGHVTTGKAEIKTVDANTKSLVISSFKTDNGPDLRLYLAEDTNAKGFIEITNKVENGDKTYTLPDNFDINKHKVVLIWCRAFSVNFGFAELKKPE